MYQLIKMLPRKCEALKSRETNSKAIRFIECCSTCSSSSQEISVNTYIIGKVKPENLFMTSYLHWDSHEEADSHYDASFTTCCTKKIWPLKDRRTISTWHCEVGHTFLWQNKHHKARKTFCKNLFHRKNSSNIMLLLCNMHVKQADFQGGHIWGKFFVQIQWLLLQTDSLGVG